MNAMSGPAGRQPSHVQGTVIVGAGPGGLSPVVAAIRTGRLDALLARGLVVVERGERIGAGLIGRYAINSDSATEAFLDCIADGSDPRLAGLLEHPTVQAMAPYKGGAVPLQMVGEFLAVLGEKLHEIIEAGGGLVLTGHDAVSAVRGADGLWTTHLRRLSDGAERVVRSRALVLGTGGYQPADRLGTEPVAGEPLLPRHEGRLMQSGDALTREGLDRIGDMIRASGNPRVAIVGGSTSAVAVAHALVNRLPAVSFPDGAITILHRRPLRVFYPTPAAARADGYDEFDDHDICPVSGFVFRLAGFRLDSRDLVMQLRGLGSRPAEPRVRLHDLSRSEPSESRRILDDAAVVVSALGYRPCALPLTDEDGQPIALRGNGPGAPSMVDGHSRVLDDTGAPIGGLYGIGLAAGFRPWGAMGGESSFTGQANGLWMWQKTVGGMIVDGLLDTATHVAA